MSDIKNILFNMIAVTRSTKDFDYMQDVIDKALAKNLISKKDHWKFKKEIDTNRHTGRKI
jgi:hypothetical protein